MFIHTNLGKIFALQICHPLSLRRCLDNVKMRTNVTATLNKRCCE